MYEYEINDIILKTSQAGIVVGGGRDGSDNSYNALCKVRKQMINLATKQGVPLPDFLNLI